MTSRVEILEIKRIICDLINRTPIIVSCAELILNNDNNPVDENNGVGTTTDPRNLEFKKKVARR